MTPVILKTWTLLALSESEMGKLAVNYLVFLSSIDLMCYEMISRLLQVHDISEMLWDVNNFSNE